VEVRGQREHAPLPPDDGAGSGGRRRRQLHDGPRRLRPLPPQGRRQAGRDARRGPGGAALPGALCLRVQWRH